MNGRLAVRPQDSTARRSSDSPKLPTSRHRSSLNEARVWLRYFSTEAQHYYWRTYADGASNLYDPRVRIYLLSQRAAQLSECSGLAQLLTFMFDFCSG